MTLAIALLLAVLQGIAEFLPISSSGHLRILQELFGIEDAQTLFDVLLHLGTLVAVVWVYRDLVLRLTRAALRALRRPGLIGQAYHSDVDFRLFVLVCLGMVPTGIIAVALGPVFERWAAAIAFVGGALLVNGAMLFGLGRLLARRDAAHMGRALEAMNWRDALVIGTVQGVAVIRGISRSGSTITGGVLVGLRQDAAAAFSFLLSIPAILGALVLSLKDFDGDTSILVPGLVGAVVAGLVGIVALRLLLRLLGRGRLGLFAGYSALVGLATILWAALR